MHMPNTNSRVPNANHIPLACVGARVGSGGHALGLQEFALGLLGFLRYQHVGISNTNRSHRGPDPKGSFIVTGFALQWNIGLRVNNIYILTMTFKSHLTGSQRTNKIEKPSCSD